MSRIYNGFDALGIGNAIRATNGNTYQMQQNALDRLSSFGDKMKEYLLEQKERKDAERQRASAIQYLANGGVNPEKAQAIVDSIGAKEAAQTALGEEVAARTRAANKEDEIDREKRGEGYKISAEERANKRDIEAEKRAYEDWLAKNNITYSQGVKSSQFGQLMQNLGITKSKDWGNSRQGIEQYNSDVKAIKDFVEKNPEYANVLNLIDLQGNNYGNDGYYDEDIESKIDTILNMTENDRTPQIEDFLTDLEKNNKLSYAKGKFGDKIKSMLRYGDGKKLSRFITAQDEGNGVVTHAGRAKEIRDNEENVRLANVKKSLQKWYNDTTGKVAIPEISEADLAKMPAKEANEYRRAKKRGK